MQKEKEYHVRLRAVNVENMSISPFMGVMILSVCVNTLFEFIMSKPENVQNAPNARDLPQDGLVLVI